MKEKYANCVLFCLGKMKNFLLNVQKKNPITIDCYNTLLLQSKYDQKKTDHFELLISI